MQTDSDRSDRSVIGLVLAGMVALAVAMGIGRFAFTPLLPLMQADLGLTLEQGGWLASANYLGYLVGAVAATRPGPSSSTLLRGGLVLVVATTALMAVGSSLALWSVVRFVAGVASAWVLVGTAALILSRLAAIGRSKLSGVVFAGVGVGIAVAGLLCQGIAVAGWSSGSGWAVLALMAAVGAVFAWHGTAGPQHGPVSAAASPPPLPESVAGGSAPQPPATVDRAAMAEPATAKGGGPLLVVCYGLFGFGYILPATFLPAQARALIADPAVFGWVWPAFGLAALASTLIAASRGRDATRRARWAAAQLVMAAGVVLPMFWESLVALIAAAFCVGGTFMVITMLGLQEARAVAGAHPQRLMAAMTAAFATGQLLGPLLVAALGAAGWPIDTVLVLAAAGLIASALLLGLSQRSPVR